MRGWGFTDANTRQPPLAVPPCVSHAEATASPRLRYGRYSCTGNVYSLTTVTLDREPFFADASNVAILVEALRFVERKGVSHSFTWVVMPDHLHWLMELRGGTLAECMALLKSRSSRLLNRRLERRGSLWQHGYHDHAVRSDESLHEKAMYILANPVRAGLACVVGEYPYAWCRWPL